MPDNEIVVTAIVSTYRSERFIRGCLEDLAAQTLFDRTEVIVVDSASPEGEGAIVREFLARHANIQYIRTECRESIYAAWNRAIRMARGRYITNANTDDRHRTDALEILASALDAHPDAAVAYADQLITNTPNQTFATATPVGRFTWPEFDPNTLLEYCCVGPQPMWRRGLHAEEGMFFNEDLEVAGDYDFWLRVSDRHPFRKVPGVLGLYYRSPQDTNREFADRHLSHAESFQVRRSAMSRLLVRDTTLDLGRRLRDCTRDIGLVLETIRTTGMTPELMRRIQYLYWFASMVLEKTGQRKEALDTAREYFNLINDGFLLTHQIKAMTLDRLDAVQVTGGPLVSVVIPTYNAIHYLEETVASVLAQSYRNIEIVCVDDGSTDGTVDILQEIAARQTGIPLRVVGQANRGPSRARNRGIQVARGEFILPLDADDQIAPRYVEKATAEFQKDQSLDVVFSEAVFYGTENKIWASEDVRLPEIFCRNFLNVTALFRKTTWKDAGGYDESLPGYEDWDLWITLAAAGRRFKLIPEPLFFYRFRADSRAARSEQRDAAKRLAIMRKHKDIYRLPGTHEQPLLRQFKRIDPSLVHQDWKDRVASRTRVQVQTSSRPDSRAAKRRRVLFVCHDFPPHIYAGAQLYALNLAKALNASGATEVEVVYPDFWTPSSGSEIVEGSFEGVRVHRLLKDHTFAFASSVRHPMVVSLLEAFLKKNAFDLVHIHELGQMSAAPIEIVKKNGLPCLMTLHTTWLLCFYWFLTTPDQKCCSGPESVEKCTECFLRYNRFGDASVDGPRLVSQFMGFRQRYFRKMFSILDRRIAPSRYMRDIYERHGFMDVAVRPLGMVPAQILPKKDSAGLRFGFIGQVSKRKGVNVLMDAFSMIAPRFPGVRLRIHGNQKDETYASGVWAQARTIPGVEYLGPYTHHELSRIMTEIDVLVVPSFWENFPLVVQEALQHKVPVIASDIAGFPEMVEHGRNGLLFEVGNPEDLAVQMARLCANPSEVLVLRDNIAPVRDLSRDKDDYLQDYDELVAFSR